MSIVIVCSNVVAISDSHVCSATYIHIVFWISSYSTRVLGKIYCDAVAKWSLFDITAIFVYGIGHNVKVVQQNTSWFWICSYIHSPSNHEHVLLIGTSLGCSSLCRMMK